MIRLSTTTKFSEKKNKTNNIFKSNTFHTPNPNQSNSNAYHSLLNPFFDINTRNTQQQLSTPSDLVIEEQENIIHKQRAVKRINENNFKQHISTSHSIHKHINLKSKQVNKNHFSSKQYTPNKHLKNTHSKTAHSTSNF
eukprot:1014749_1